MSYVGALRLLRLPPLRGLTSRQERVQSIDHCLLGADLFAFILPAKIESNNLLGVYGTKNV